MKQRLALLLVVSLLLSTLCISLPIAAVAAGDTTTVTIHYKPAEGNTLDWNMWLWPEGKDGAAYKFTGNDSFGQVLTTTFDGEYDRIGFIVRTDDWKKDVDADRFMDVIAGEAEIWLISGDPTIYTEDPEGGSSKQSFEKVNVKLHYHRFENDYAGWKLKAWPQDKEAVEVSFNGEDAFGKVASFTLSNMKDARKIGFVVSRDANTAEGSGERFIQKINDDGTAEVWVVQGQEKVYYSEDKAMDAASPKILKAVIEEIDRLSVETNVPFAITGGDEGFKLLSGGTAIAITKVEGVEPDASGKVLKAILTTAKPLDVNASYTLEKSGYGAPFPVTLGNIYGSPSFDERFAYDGELGALYGKEKTTFRLWAPTAQAAKLVIYDKWDSASGKEIDMAQGERGTWSAELKGDQDGTIFTYKVNIGGTWNEAVDPYARAVTVNGDKGVVVDLAKTAPENWSKDQKPALKNATDAVIYELHVRDLSIAPDSGIKNKGKFLGLTETGTTGPGGTKTGLDHIKDLGVTHVQLLPFFDYNSVDETKMDQPQFNWGYDPKNYNAPEGSYSSDPYNPTTRITELKQTVKSLHDNGLRIIMDVVYNHMFAADSSNLGKLVPGYYYRYDENGKLSNGTGVGNDTASERAMMRRLIVDSVKYWVQEYHVDGFRFDLMGIHDVETMNMVRAELDKIDPSIIVIGEGWNLGTLLPDKEKANQLNAFDMPRIGHFNDAIRDGLKGSVFDHAAAGFVNGDLSKADQVRGGIVGGIKYNVAVGLFTSTPDQSVNYVEAHDNNTLWDKLLFTNPDDSDEDRKKMHKLASSVVMTSQGIPFIHAGQEFMRTKGGNENSYNSPDEVNQLDWARKAENQDVVDYFKGMIELRKAHPAFRMMVAQDVRDHLAFLETDDGVIAFTLNDYANGDSWQTIAVAHNANREAKQLKLPSAGTWNIVQNGEKSGVEVIASVEGDTVEVPALTSLVLYTGEVKAPAAGDEALADGGQSDSNRAIWITAGVLVLLILIAAGWYLTQRRRKQ